MTVPDFIRRAIEAQGRTTVDAVEAAMNEGVLLDDEPDDAPAAAPVPRHWQEEAEDRGRE
jgi:hypothetical protein